MVDAEVLKKADDGLTFGVRGPRIGGGRPHFEQALPLVLADPAVLDCGPLIKSGPNRIIIRWGGVANL